MTTPTNKPVPSQDPRDLLFNAEKVDEAVNTSNLQYLDRFGVPRQTLAGAIDSIKAVNVRGAWTTATAYQSKDVVSNAGTWYICVAPHTSGATFAGDLAANWRVYQGVVASDLSNTSDATKGAGLSGYNQSLAYAASTAGRALQRTISLRAQGATLDGVADDTAYVQAAFALANGTGKRVVFDGPACKITSAISQNNHAHYDVDWGGCQVTYTGGAGTYMLDMTQAGRIRHTGGVFTGSGTNHLAKMAGSAAAQATLYPTIPAESQWTRQCEFHPKIVTGFSIALDMGNFTREFTFSGDFTGNVTAVKMTGKVVNVDFTHGVLYSALASSQAVFARGDAADATFRYSEGCSFSAACVMDTQGTTVDVRDAYDWLVLPKQIKTASGGIAFDLTKGVCPITRNVTVSSPLMQGRVRIGNGLASAFLFAFKGIGLGFSDTDGTALDIQGYSTGVMVNGASFNSPAGTARMFAIGANCSQIKLDGLTADPSTYTNAPTIDSTSYTGVEAEFSGSFTPAIAFGGASVGVTYSNQVGRYYWRGGMVSGFFELTVTNKGASVGALTITGLPFQCKLVNGVATIGKFATLSTAFTPVLDITKNTSVINVKTGASGSEAAFTNADLPGGATTVVLNGSFCFPIS